MLAALGMHVLSSGYQDLGVIRQALIEPARRAVKAVARVDGDTRPAGDRHDPTGVVPLRDAAGRPRLPDGLRPLGLVAVRDELRPEARTTLQGFAEAGVRLKIISGDNPQTVAALARQAGLGPALAAMDEAAFAQAAATVTVFGRITPQQKERLVQALRRQGGYVAMIGDGVNDVLSLKEANSASPCRAAARRPAAWPTSSCSTTRSPRCPPRCARASASSTACRISSSCS